MVTKNLICTFAFMILLSFGNSMNAQSSMKSDLTSYLNAYVDGDLDAIIRFINPKHFEKVVSIDKFKKGYRSFVNNNNFVTTFTNFTIDEVKDIKVINGEKYQRIKYTQQVVMDGKDPPTEKEKVEISAAFNSMFGAENWEVIPNGYKVNMKKEAISWYSNEKNQWYFVEYMEIRLADLKKVLGNDVVDVVLE